MRHRQAPVLLGLAFVMTVSAGAAQILLGTEDLPELTDPTGNVQYSPLYPGPRDHEYLDLNASWLDADATLTWLTLHLRVAGTLNFETSLSESNVHCTLIAALSTPSGERLGNITWRFNFYNGTAEHQRTNRTTIGGGSAVHSNLTDERTLKTRFHVVYGSPGYFEWTIQREHVLQYATNLLDLQAECVEQWGNPASVFSPVLNHNSATSLSNYSVPENRRVAGPDGRPDDLASLSRRLPPIVRPSSEAAFENGSAIGGLGLALAILVAIVVKHGSRR